MPRTTVGKVQNILAAGEDYNGETSLQPYVDAATLLVTRVAACAVERGRDLTSDELEMIERWLAAHCYVQSDQTYASKSTSKASASFHGQTGLRLDNSKYGQMALALDTSGCLQALTAVQRQVASAFWLGKVPSEQTDYVDRD